MNVWNKMELNTDNYKLIMQLMNLKSSTKTNISIQYETIFWTTTILKLLWVTYKKKKKSAIILTVKIMNKHTVEQTNKQNKLKIN